MKSEDAADPTLDALLPSTESDLQATVFVHSLAPVACKESQDRLVADLEELAERGTLDGVDLLVWGKSICTNSPLTDLGSGQQAIDAIGEFYDLAANTSVSISPFFNVSTVTTEYSDEPFSRIVPPHRAIALYEESELAAVFPCLIDGTAYTPEDAVAYLSQEGTMATEPPLVDESA